MSPLGLASRQLTDATNRHAGDWLVRRCRHFGKVNPADLPPLASQRTNFPARELYERTFPRIVSDYSDVFYWPGSPWAGKSTRDLTEGDVQCVSFAGLRVGIKLTLIDDGTTVSGMFGTGRKSPTRTTTASAVASFPNLVRRLAPLPAAVCADPSLAGMEGAPDVGTIDYFLDGDTSQLFPQSRTLDAHNKAAGHERRLALYVTENIRSGTTLEDYVYATQFVQAEAMASAFGGWRRKFEGGVGGAKCAGALVWQLNDVVCRSSCAAHRSRS